MSFKLQITDEMARFFRDRDSLSDADAGKLIRFLLDAAEEIELPERIPQPLTYSLPIFVGQIERFRFQYERKKQMALERQRIRRERLSGSVTRDTRDTRDERDKRDKRDERDKRDTACHANTIPYHTISDHGSTEPKPNARARPGSESDRFGGIDYQSIYDPSNDVVSLAVEFCNENNPLSARRAFQRQLTRISDAVFRGEFATYWAEIMAGEEPNSRGAAFMARLKRIEDCDASESESAKQAIAALNNNA